MDKLLLFPGKSEQGVFTYVLGTEQAYLTKTAAEYHPEIANYINSAKTIPGKTQILLTALGAGEYWGCNVNGDYFPEASLSHFGEDYGYKTFEYNAKIYKHHINKDPKASYGHVALAVYNPKYHRVELIVVLENDKAPDIVDRIENGDYPEWSMGCRVPYDVCSICGNKARTRKEYCDHLKYYMGRIHPETGKQAYAINTVPKFFDISQVLIGADKIAKTLRKVASTDTSKPAISSALLAEKMAGTKISSIDKEIPAGDPPASQESVEALSKSIPEVKSYEKPIPPNILDRLGSFGLNDAMSTMSFLGILPKPQEFQRIMLISIGRRDIADQLDRHNMCFDPCVTPNDQHMKLMDVSSNRFRPEIMNVLSPYMEERSYMSPFLGRRILMIEKNASTLPQYLPNFIKISADRKPVGIMPMLALAAGLYAALSKKNGPEVAGKLDQLISKYPSLAATLALGGAMVFNRVVGPKRVGEIETPSTANADVIDVARRIEEMKQKPYTKTAAFVGPAAKRLFLGIPAVYMTSGTLQKQKQTDPYYQEGAIKSFIRQYPDVISSGLALDALAGSRGTHGLLKKLEPHAHGAAKKARGVLGKVASEKTADAHDMLTNALIWPLAAGGANLPAKIVGGLFDQAVFETGKKLLSNKKQENTINRRR